MRLRSTLPALVLLVAGVSSSAANAADLEVLIQDRPDAVAANGFLDYTITVRNNGPDNAIGATVTQTLPSNARFVSMRAPNGWSCTHPYPGTFGQVVCSPPAVFAPGASFNIGVRVQAPPICGPNMMISTTVFIALGTDPNQGNNLETEPTLVAGKPCFGGF